MTWTHWRHLDLLVHIYDIVADCSDNVPTRYLVNDACVLSGKPLVSASALRLEGQVRLTLNLNIGIQNIELLHWLYVRMCVCVFSWRCTTTAEVPATDVSIQCHHPQRQWPTVQMEEFWEWVSCLPLFAPETMYLVKKQNSCWLNCSLFF